MSLAEQIQVISNGLFDPTFPPETLEQVLSNGTSRVVTWHRMRPAIASIKQMTWCNVQSEWDFFLDPDRYPVGRPLELRPDEIRAFQNLLQALVNEAGEGIRILSSVHPSISLTDVVVTIETTDLETLAAAMNHVRRATELAAIDDAISVSSLQSGSIDIVLTAGQVSLYGLTLAILLAKLFKDPQIAQKVGLLKRLLMRIQPDSEWEEEVLNQGVLDDVKETFWQSAGESLKTAVGVVGKNHPEAQNKIDLAAKEIYERSDEVAADWKLPPATITGLPGGLAVSLHYDEPESIGRVIRALARPPENMETDM